MNPFQIQPIALLRGWLAASALALGFALLTAVPLLAAAAPAAIETAEVTLPPGPLPVGDVRPGPVVRALPALLIVAFAPPLLLWAGLALAQSRRQDAFRDRRASARALARCLRGMQPGAVTAAELEIWRAQSVRFWRVPVAAPTADELADCTNDPAAWRALWAEAEASLFSPRPQLPSDWVARARAGFARRVQLPRLTWLPVRRGHWIPAATAALVAVACIGLVGAHLTAAEPARPENPADLFAQKRYADAAKLWRAQAAERPRDWATHYNAALAYGQGGDWGRAAGHWTAAWLVNRDERVVEAGALIGLSQLGGVDASLRRLLVGRFRDRFAARQPVAGWERWALGAAAAVALGLGCAVISLYTPVRPKLWRRGGLALALVAGGIGYVAVDAIARHGWLADPLAAFVTDTADVRSIPSELMTNQQAATLFPGTVVLVDRTFLGWDHVRTENGSEGWVRSEQLVWLYGRRDPDAIATVLRR